MRSGKYSPGDVDDGIVGAKAPSDMQPMQEKDDDVVLMACLLSRDCPSEITNACEHARKQQKALA